MDKEELWKALKEPAIKTCETCVGRIVGRIDWGNVPATCHDCIVAGPDHNGVPSKWKYNKHKY